MAEAVVSFALETLRNLLFEEVKFLSGVSSEVKALQTQLKELQCLSKDADKRRHKSDTVRNWISQIRNLAYKAEDVIETYAFDVSSRRRRGGSVKKLLRRFACALNKGFTLYHIGSQILEIKSDIERVTKSMQEYGITNIIQGGESSSAVAEEKRRLQRQTYPFEIEDCFVGMEEDLKKLVSLIIDDDDVDEQHKVVSIWGMGGIGKTTIARKVYNHDEIRSSFGSFAWVCITQECQLRSVYEEVFRQLIPHRTEEIARLDVRGLIEQLREVQKDKRCMIVLDDLWKISDWKTLNHAFLVPGANSKVLITTRKQNIANVGFSYKLGLLNGDDGWDLLKNKAFPRNNASTDFGVEEKELIEKVGKEMVHKCGHLPLAISLLGGVLKSAKSLKEWESVSKNIDRHLYNREEGVGEENKMDGVLDLSYEDLPYYLKQCLLYMGCLKEDEIIEADQLYMLWIAQGMVSDQAGRREDETLKDVAELYLSELASRSIVKVEVSSRPGSKYESCQLHDVVRELCLSKGKKEDFHLKVVDHRGGKFSISDRLFSGSETRHLVIYIRGDAEFTIADHHEEKEEVTDKTRVRSLQLFNGYQKCKVDFTGKNTVDFQKLKLLRVLKFVRCSFEGRKLPKEIGDLIHLRYLGFQKCGGLEELPSSISNLTYLYCLDLYFSYDIRIPNVLKKMFRLKHLSLPIYSEKKIGNYRLSLEGLDLETLFGFNSLVHDFKSLSTMKNLRHLNAEVHDNESMSSIIDIINSKKWPNLSFSNIEIRKGCEFTSSSSSNQEEGSVVLKKVLTSLILNELTIRDVPIRKLIPDFRTITPHQLILPNLVCLVLWGCKIEDDPMEMLEKLPSLETLYLYERCYVGEEMICHAMGFPRLKVLELYELPNLREWRVEQGAMPILSQLEISSSPRLEMVPDGLRFITTLKELDIWGMPELGKRVSKWIEDEQREGEDFDKVRHVPSITIYN